VINRFGSLQGATGGRGIDAANSAVHFNRAFQPGISTCFAESLPKYLIYYSL